MFGKKMSSKGRSGASNSSSHTGKGGKATPPGASDAPFVVPHIKVQESFKLLPKYSAALSRPHDDLLPAEDLDAIQMELEMLLSTAALRSRMLKNEYESFDKDDKREKRGKHMDRQPPSPPPSKRKVPEEKRSKDGARYFGTQIKVAKLKNSNHSPAASHNTDDSMDSSHHQGNHTQRDTKLSIPKNDIPNKFWLSVEPYCMPITHEDIKLLDDLIQEYSGALVPPIPELGPHYSTQWAAEDLKEEQDSSNANAKLNKRFMSGSNSDVVNMIKKGEKLMGDGITGPLTQRLVSAFLEENVVPTEGLSSNSDPTTDTNNADDNPSNRIMSMLNNGISIERRVKKELIEQGLLDPEDFTKGNDDEILAEIKRVRTELSAISEYNSSELKKLYAAAKEEMKRLEIKRKLDVVDQEIVEMYKKIATIKQKRRSLTKQEREEVLRLTEEQKRLSDQLESMSTPGLALL